MGAPSEQQQRRRAGAGLGAIFIGVMAVLVVLGALLISWTVTGRGPTTPPPRPPAPVPASGAEQGAAARQLALRPMTELPPQAIEPQPLSTDQAGPAIRIPAPTAADGRWIPSGFPRTPEGALGQLVALDESAFKGADPAMYAKAYRSHALPGAAPVERTGLSTLLSSLRSSAGVAQNGLVPELTAHYEPTHGQIKGSAENGGFVVACVLGQFSVDYRGQTVTAGIGDCQALRWTGRDWRIAPAPLAAPAPSAWPGSDLAVAAGYRDLRRAD